MSWETKIEEFYSLRKCELRILKEIYLSSNFSEILDTNTQKEYSRREHSTHISPKFLTTQLFNNRKYHGSRIPWIAVLAISSVQFSCSVVSDSLWPHESQHSRPPCPSPTPWVYPNPCASSQWCHPAISSSVIPFSSCPQSLLASESFPMSFSNRALQNKI